MYGQVAILSGKFFPLMPLKSAAGWYLGTQDEEGMPYSRESAEYFPSQSAAESALQTDAWTQRWNS